jgi:hypothetical protein
MTVGRGALNGGVGRLLDTARSSLRSIPLAIGEGLRGHPVRHQREQDSTADETPAQRAAWIRFLAAYIALDERRTVFDSSPSDLTAEQVRWAEVELEDAIAVAGEFQVHDLTWSLG